LQIHHEKSLKLEKFRAFTKETNSQHELMEIIVKEILWTGGFLPTVNEQNRYESRFQNNNIGNSGNHGGNRQHPFKKQFKVEFSTKPLPNHHANREKIAKRKSQLYIHAKIVRRVLCYYYGHNPYELGIDDDSILTLRTIIERITKS